MSASENPHRATHTLLSLNQAAAVAGVSPRTLLAWTAEGKGPAPYRRTPDGLPTAWTLHGINVWREKRKVGRA